MPLHLFWIRVLCYLQMKMAVLKCARAALELQQKSIISLAPKKPPAKGRQQTTMLNAEKKTNNFHRVQTSRDKFILDKTSHWIPTINYGEQRKGENRTILRSEITQPFIGFQNFWLDGTSLTRDSCQITHGIWYWFITKKLINFCHVVRHRTVTRNRLENVTKNAEDWKEIHKMQKNSEIHLTQTTTKNVSQNWTHASIKCI